MLRTRPNLKLALKVSKGNGLIRCITHLGTSFHYHNAVTPFKRNISHQALEPINTTESHKKHNKNDTNCVSCGVHLQSDNPKAVGYYTAPKSKAKNKNVGIDDLKYLLFSQEFQKAKDLERKLYDPEIEGDVDARFSNLHSKILSPEMIDKERNHRLSCKRCIDLINRNSYDLEKDFTKYTYEDIKSKFLTKKNNEQLHVVQTVPLTYFPIGIEKKIVDDYRPNWNNGQNETNELSILFSKCDQVLGSESSLTKKAPIFMEHFFEKYLNVKKGSIKLDFFSSLKKWNIEATYNILKRDLNYLIGAPNAGKSTLINSWLKKYPNSHRFDFSKAQKSFHSQKAGVSHIPNMTRNMNSYMINGDTKVVNDLPGFDDNFNRPNLQDLVQKDFCDLILKTDKFKNSKVVKRPYLSVKGKEESDVLGKAYTIGGLFYFIPIPRSIVKIHQFIPGPDYIFKSLDKGITAANELKVQNNPKMAPMEPFLLCKPPLADKKNFARHVIPPFVGSIEVVLDGIGYFQVSPAGFYQFTGLFEIWVPRGIKVAVRAPLQRSIDETFESYIEEKNNKSDSKSAIKYNDHFPKSPLVSNTYIVPHDMPRDDLLQEVRRRFMENTSSEVMKRGPFISTVKEEMVLLNAPHRKDIRLYWHYKF